MYYEKLEQVDNMIDELVAIKNSFAERLVDERDEQLMRAKKAYENACTLAELDYKYKMNYLDNRFSESLEKALSQLGAEIPEEIRNKTNQGDIQ